MKAVELEKSYNPKDFEDRIYADWKEHGCFQPDAEAPGEPFTVVMPPPNVTGILHMGHALNNQLQDTLVRYHRMCGRPALWVPGTDHAGIATQNVVERQLAAKGLRRQDLGREKFVEETWKVKERHHAIISQQLEKIGSSCDWTRERFTMDEGLSQAVRESFVTLYERGLVYKGNYLVNYCTHCGTALADDEVEYKNLPGKLYQVQYPYADGSGNITVATTRPETMFGDVAVAVNPADERYAHLVGTFVILPLANKRIPIIADSYVDMEFGTGMVKITPAHDPNDWEIGRRHDLEMVNILNADGTLNDAVPEVYRNMDVTSARKLVVADLVSGGYLVGQTDHNHDVGHCYRCSTVIEPYLSEQWFVSMKGMADKALGAWKDGKIVFYAKRWENTYSHWLENIRDWCISRQLWWGHRIPVWYCQDCGQMMVERKDPTSCNKCGSSTILQDTDVLDTWFSSWLWPFSTLGWPESTPDLKRFFPTSTLVTGYDIIFFWVSRMIMASLEFLGEVPFRDIYITGLVRDKQGRKMSKSLGNGIDPLEVVDLYGADAMKFTLCYMAAQGQDILIDMESFKLGSRFANKMWNATRFLLMNLEGKELVPIVDSDLNIMDRWMYRQVNEAASRVKAAIEGYRFNDGAQAIYDVFWNDFCDWYVEATKHALATKDEAERNRQVSVMLDLLAELMRLMHPFVSFITEEIYGKLPNTTGRVIDAPYPSYREERNHDDAKAIVDAMQELVRGVRSLRSELQIPNERKLQIVFRPDAAFVATGFVSEHVGLISTFVGASQLVVDAHAETSVAKAIPVAGHGFEVFVFVRDAIDVDSEIRKIEIDLERNAKSLEGTLRKLSNEQFMSNAKQEAIDKERGKQAEFEEKLEKGRKHLTLLRSL
ncbi:MAG: valine--tRNA ligase [Spirochaetae bacterium HGW-Spirochaetae-2]|jgi:valyl-tRNA synthetase|nr:MAG: valine--tRNA ligase [Spirochaetae bacterium HGW-Spirochaetae-2]